MLGAAALFSTGGAAIKYCGFDAWQVAAFRSGVAALVLLAFLPAARRGWTWRTLIVALAYAATMVLFVTSNKLTTSAATIFLQSTAPLYLLLLGPWLLREPVRARDVGVIAMLAAGLAMMVLGAEAPQVTAPDPVRGNVLAALSGAAWALTIGGLRWLGRRGEQAHAAPAVVAGNLLACLACLPLALPLGPVGPGDVVSILYLGAFQIGLAYVLLTGGIGHVAALEASLLLLLEPVLNPLWSWLVHGETPGPWTVAGGVLILGASLVQVVVRPPANRDRKDR